jgi:hypothetical protein
MHPSANAPALTVLSSTIQYERWVLPISSRTAFPAASAVNITRKLRHASLNLQTENACKILFGKSEETGQIRGRRVAMSPVSKYIITKLTIN